MARGRKPLSKDIVNERLKSNNRDVRLIGEFITAASKSLFRCSFGHEWFATVRNVLHKNGCPHCSNRVPMTTILLNEKLRNRGIQIIEECRGMQIKSRFRCSSGHEWIATPDSIANSGNGCPSCATYGFNTLIPAYAYVLEFDNFIKYGIANNIDSRLQKHTRAGDYTIIATKLYNSGQEAFDWERSIKKTFGGNYVNKTVMNDGFTETLPKSLLESVVQTLGDIHV